MKLALSFVVVAISFTPFIARADTVQCKGVKLKSVTVEGARDDNHNFNNKLILTLVGECGGKAFAHLEIGNPAFEGILHVALAAKIANKPVSLAVNTSKATDLSNQIAYVELE